MRQTTFYGDCVSPIFQEGVRAWLLLKITDFKSKFTRLAFTWVRSANIWRGTRQSILHNNYSLQRAHACAYVQCLVVIKVGNKGISMQEKNREDWLTYRICRNHSKQIINLLNHGDQDLYCYLAVNKPGRWIGISARESTLRYRHCQWNVGILYLYIYIYIGELKRNKINKYKK